jgi:hypothetical protein
MSLNLSPFSGWVIVSLAYFVCLNFVIHMCARKLLCKNCVSRFKWLLYYFLAGGLSLSFLTFTLHLAVFVDVLTPPPPLEVIININLCTLCRSDATVISSALIFEHRVAAMLLSSNLPAPGQLSIWALLQKVPGAVYINRWSVPGYACDGTITAWWTANLVIRAAMCITLDSCAAVSAVT